MPTPSTRPLQPGVLSLAACGPRLKYGQYKAHGYRPVDNPVIYSLKVPLLGLEAREAEVGSLGQGCRAAALETKGAPQRECLCVLTLDRLL